MVGETTKTEKEQKQNSTPGKASSVVENMQHKKKFPPSLQKLFDDLQNMTPPCKSSAATSQDMWPQNTQKYDAVSPDILSQNSNTSPSRYTNPERELAFETPERNPRNATALTSAF